MSCYGTTGVSRPFDVVLSARRGCGCGVRAARCAYLAPSLHGSRKEGMLRAANRPCGGMGAEWHTSAFAGGRGCAAAVDKQSHVCRWSFLTLTRPLLTCAPPPFPCTHQEEVLFQQLSEKYRIPLAEALNIGGLPGTAVRPCTSTPLSPCTALAFDLSA